MLPMTQKSHHSIINTYVVINTYLYKNQINGMIATFSIPINSLSKFYDKLISSQSLVAKKDQFLRSYQN